VEVKRNSRGRRDWRPGGVRATRTQIRALVRQHKLLEEERRGEKSRKRDRVVKPTRHRVYGWPSHEGGKTAGRGKKWIENFDHP